METIIEVYSDRIYGRPLFYPYNELAKQLVDLLGKETLSPVNLQKLKAMGFTVEDLTFSPDQS